MFHASYFSPKQTKMPFSFVNVSLIKKIITLRKKMWNDKHQSGRMLEPFRLDNSMMLYSTSSSPMLNKTQCAIEYWLKVSMLLNKSKYANENWMRSIMLLMTPSMLLKTEWNQVCYWKLNKTQHTNNVCYCIKIETMLPNTEWDQTCYWLLHEIQHATQT